MKTSVRVQLQWQFWLILTNSGDVGSQYIANLLNFRFKLFNFIQRSKYITDYGLYLKRQIFYKKKNAKKYLPIFRLPILLAKFYTKFLNQ